MKFLAIDTSTEACSAALYIDGEVRELFEIAPRIHTKLILPMIEELMSNAELKPQQLDGVAFGRGPGSFTGIRIATGVIHGIAYGADLPVAPVSTLAAIAQGYFKENSSDCAFVGMDARMNEIFWGVYEKDAEGFARLIGKEAVTPAEKIDCPEVNGIGLGSAWSLYHQILSECIGSRLLGYEADHLPHATVIAELGVNMAKNGQAVAVENAMPVYLRDKVAKKESER